MDEFIYKPPSYPGPIELNATIGVKFCRDTFLLKSFLDQQKIYYDEKDLEQTPCGLALRVKKENDR